MRLREPFAGYKLSSGHYLFHIAYLVGSLLLPISFEESLQAQDDVEAENILKMLRMAHMVVPILQFIQELMEVCGFYTIGKCLGIISIF